MNSHQKNGMAIKDGIIDRGWFGTLCSMLFVILSAIGIFEIRIRSSLSGFDQKMNDIVDSGIYPGHPGLTIRQQYTGSAPLDRFLAMMSAAFLPSVLPFSEQQQVQMAYFLLSTLSMLAIFSVEAFRRGSHRAWISYTSILAILLQTASGAFSIPIWFVLFLRHSARSKSYYEPSSLRISIPYARGLVPAHLLGYLLPTIALLLPFHDADLKQVLIAFWQPSPLYINILLVVLAQVYSLTDSIKTAADSDLTHIKALHACSFITTLVAHGTLLYRWSKADWSMTDIFVPNANLLRGSVPEVIYYIFQLDYAVCFIVSLLATYIVLMDLNTMKRCDLSPITVGGGIIVASLVIGPAAVVSAAWWWREGRLRADRNSKPS